MHIGWRISPDVGPGCFLKRTPNASHDLVQAFDCNRRGRLRCRRGRRSAHLIKLPILHCNGALNVANLCLDKIAVLLTPDHVRDNVVDAKSLVRLVLH
jgi:hypothetical protein